jgi:hypothetical protein
VEPQFVVKVCVVIMGVVVVVDGLNEGGVFVVHGGRRRFSMSFRGLAGGSWSTNVSGEETDMPTWWPASVG